MKRSNKKKLLVLAAAAMISALATAQPRSIGGRFGYGAELTYQHTVGKNFVELDWGYNYARGNNVTAKYDFVIAKPQWTPKGLWEFYAGPGLFVGSDFKDKPFIFGISAQVGLAYTFEFPLQLSIDIMPTGGFYRNDSSDVTFNKAGLFGFVPTIGVRYCFGR